MASHNRPLSPHIFAWRWRLHMILSILHRATGMANAVTAVLLVWWLSALAGGPDYYRVFTDLTGSLIGHLVLLGLTFALMLHLCTGIRHLVMDTGAALEPQTNRRFGAAMVVTAFVLTLAVWGAAYLVLQGA